MIGASTTQVVLSWAEVTWWSSGEGLGEELDDFKRVFYEKMKLNYYLTNLINIQILLFLKQTIQGILFYCDIYYYLLFSV